MHKAATKRTGSRSVGTGSSIDLQKFLERQHQEAKAFEEEEREQQRSEQLEKGQCNIKPFPSVATQPFRSELTIEQNSLFVTNQYKGDYFSREWTVSHPDSGEPVNRKLTVGRVGKGGKHRGVLTQIHQDVFYKLLGLWGRRGYTLGKVGSRTYAQLEISAYELVMTLRGDDGSHHYLRVQDLLQDLSAIPVVLENVYNWQGLRNREQFTLLDGFRWSERQLDRNTGLPDKEGDSTVTILFSSFVTEGFLQKHVKTLLDGPYQKLGTTRRSEIARLLYPFLDAQLSSKDSYHIRLKALEERFGFDARRYKSQRRQRFAFAVKQLNGTPILGERYCLRIALQEDASGDDWVLVAKRELSGQMLLPLA